MLILEYSIIFFFLVLKFFFEKNNIPKILALNFRIIFRRSYPMGTIGVEKFIMNANPLVLICCKDHFKSRSISSWG